MTMIVIVVRSKQNMAQKKLLVLGMDCTESEEKGFMVFEVLVMEVFGEIVVVLWWLEVVMEVRDEDWRLLGWWKWWLKVVMEVVMVERECCYGGERGC
jgi:hypothetical protein